MIKTLQLIWKAITFLLFQKAKVVRYTVPQQDTVALWRKITWMVYLYVADVADPAKSVSFSIQDPRS